MTRESAGPYRLLDPLGEDRLGETWRARDMARGRTGFVRLVHARITGDPAERAALVADATRAAAISHPAVVALFDVIDEGADVALAHEHVDGKTLAATLGGTPLNPRLAVAIAIQIADGLAELHAAEMQHGAVDAEHVIISNRGQAKLLDAGLVRWLSVAPPAPDDIASLGRLLSTMTGSALPRGQQWSDELRGVIDRTRADHPRRYQAVATLAAELRSIAAMLEARAEAAPPVKKSSGTSVVVWVLIAAALLALGGWFLLQ